MTTHKNIYINEVTFADAPQRELPQRRLFHALLPHGLQRVVQIPAESPLQISSQGNAPEVYREANNHLGYLKQLAQGYILKLRGLFAVLLGCPLKKT